MAEVFKSKYTAEQIEEIFDHVNEKNEQIILNKEAIEKLQENSPVNYTDEEVTNAIAEVLNPSTATEVVTEPEESEPEESEPEESEPEE